MSKSTAIAVGDLVVVVKPLECCGNDSGLGVTFRVASINPHELGRCVFCGRGDQTGPMAARSDGVICQIRRLKRIPPLEDLEGMPSEDEMDIFDFLDK